MKGKNTILKSLEHIIVYWVMISPILDQWLKLFHIPICYKFRPSEINLHVNIAFGINVWYFYILCTYTLMLVENKIPHLCGQWALSHNSFCSLILVIKETICLVESLPSNLLTEEGTCHEGSNVTYPQFCSFICEKGYTLIGNRTVLCLPSGRFDNDFPVCSCK